MKCETKAHLGASLPMNAPNQTMKRRASFLMPFVSCELSLVSARFTFRFTPSARVRDLSVRPHPEENERPDVKLGLLHRQCQVVAGAAFVAH